MLLAQGLRHPSPVSGLSGLSQRGDLGTWSGRHISASGMQTTINDVFCKWCVFTKCLLNVRAEAGVKLQGL